VIENAMSVEHTRHANIQVVHRYHMIRWFATVVLAYPCVTRAQQVGPSAFAATLDANTGHIDIESFAGSSATTLSPTLWGTTPLHDRVQFTGMVTDNLSRFSSGNLSNYFNDNITVDFDTTVRARPSLNIDNGITQYRRNEQGYDVESGNYVITSLRWGHPDETRAGSIPLGSLFENRLVFGGWGSVGIGQAHTAAQEGGLYMTGRTSYTSRLAEGSLSAQWQTLTAAYSTQWYDVAGFHYKDVTISTTWRPMPNVQIQGTSGVRDGWAFYRGRHVADLSVILPFIKQSALIVSTGNTLTNPAQMAVAARYFNVTTRVWLGGVRRSTSPSRMLSAIEHNAAVSDLNPDGSRTLTLALPAAKTVELMGDFTAWRPVAMTRTSNGGWSTSVVLPQGSHRMDVRVDGGPWRAPPGLPDATDDFGGLVGVLVIR
jgi:hypothetical protein